MQLKFLLLTIIEATERIKIIMEISEIYNYAHKVKILGTGLNTEFYSQLVFPPDVSLFLQSFIFHHTSGFSSSKGYMWEWISANNHKFINC